MGIIRDIERKIEFFEKKDREPEERELFARRLVVKFDIFLERIGDGRDIRDLANYDFMLPSLRRVARRYSRGEVTMNEVEKRVVWMREDALKYLAERGYEIN